MLFIFVFFFKQKTAYEMRISDWSSDVCSSDLTMFRDPGCGCCLNWAGHVEDGMNTKVASVDSKDMAAIKTARGVPEELWSCHTMEVDGYIIEGHVPAEAVAKLLSERPAGVAGLAVPGMPLGRSEERRVGQERVSTCRSGWAPYP